MSIRTRGPNEPRGNPDYDYHRRKSDQAWEMAALARQDGDIKDMEKWTAIAREHGRLAVEATR